MDKQISKEDLEAGRIYIVAARKFNVAVWTGKAFKGPIKVDGKWYLVEENHFTEGLPLGTASASSIIGELDVNFPYDGQNLLAALQALSELLEERKANE